MPELRKKRAKPKGRSKREMRRVTGSGSKLRRRLDTIQDALGPRAIRQRGQRWQRAIGLTRYGGIALIGFILLWASARVIAGTAMYLFAYGLLLLVGLAYFLVPKRLKLEGDRSGLFPRVQEGDRLDVEVRLRANRTVSTFILEERVPDRLGNPVRRVSSSRIRVRSFTRLPWRAAGRARACPRWSAAT